MRIAPNKTGRIFLVGPMGVGKTTIGRMLARELKLEFVDCDLEIEERTGASVAWIFDVEGEEGFRQRETQMLDELTSRDRILLATGGGAVLRQQNRDYLKRGTVVHLDSSVDMLVRRTAKDKKRPLLQNSDPRQVLDKVKRDRDPLYQKVSDIRVFVGNSNSRNVVNQILKELEQEGLVE